MLANKWMFEHKTSSPTYPQSNGKSENAVQTVKRLFAKCKSLEGSEFQALLHWRNTATAGIGSSPAQRLFGRRCKTMLPVAGSLLQPSYPTEEDTRKIIGAKQRQQYYYNRQSKPLERTAEGDLVRMKLPGQDNWSPGVLPDNKVQEAMTSPLIGARTGATQDNSLKQQRHTQQIQFQWKFLLVTTSSNPTNLAFAHRICSHHRDHAAK